MILHAKGKGALVLAGTMLLSLLTGCGAYKNSYLLNVTYSDYVKLGEYKGVEATKVTFDVSQEEIDNAVEEVMYDYVSYNDITDRAAQEGDNANITYVAKIDGKEDEDYSGENEDVVIGEEYIYPEVEQALIGMKTGDKKDVSVEATDDYFDEDVVGKKVVVEVTLNDLTEEVYPDYNDDFVKDNTDYSNVKEYEESLKKNITEEKEEEFKQTAVEEILETVVANSEFNGYPQELYDSCAEEYDANNEYMASMYQMELSEYEEMLGLDEESKKEEIVAAVNQELVIGAIAQAEQLSVTVNDVKSFAKEHYEEYESESADKFIDEYGEEEIGEYLTYEKVADFLYDNAKFNEITEDEYYEQQGGFDMFDGEDGEEIEAEEGVDMEVDEEEDVRKADDSETSEDKTTTESKESSEA